MRFALIVAAVPSFLALACEAAPREAEVTASTPRGGVVRFAGWMIGGAIEAAQRKCREDAMDAVPLGFFQIGTDDDGRDRVMTFQCVK